jgi:membrane associated rhomboid family serine protease
MIPIRDATPSRNVPVVNNILIGINVLMFMVQLMQGPAGNRFIYTYGLVPGRYTIERLAEHFSLFQQIIAWVSFMFLHGGFLHLLGNMWFLYIFGDNVEDRLGPVRYLIFYLLCGVASGVSQFLINSHATFPTIGASGAIAGVMGAYFLLHPKSKILTLVPVFFIPLFFEIPAVFFLGFWFLLQFINAAAGASGNIAWWAHVGGFLWGMLLLKLLDVMPSTGVTSRMRKMTVKKKTHRIQVARPDTTAPQADTHAILVISPYEALVGARKLVTIPSGMQRRVYRINVPPGISAGKLLRLKGQGKISADGTRGDLLLKIAIQ